MHAEKCPVCNGHGKIHTPTGTPETSPDIVPCHGCTARGWVGVMDLADTLAVTAAVQRVLPAASSGEPSTTPTTRFVLTPGLVKRLDEDGKYHARITKATEAAGIKRVEEVEVYALSLGNLWLVDPKEAS